MAFGFKKVMSLGNKPQPEANAGADALMQSMGINGSTGIAGAVYLVAFSGPVLTVILAGTTTTLAAGVQNAMALSGNTPKSSLLSVYTVAATQADKHLCAIGSFDAVTTAAGPKLLRNFDGGMVVPPGTMIGVSGSAAQTSIAHIEFMYAEVPV